ncbi:MAG: hypothetical protein HYW88_00110, partial [Candidatus Sungbacteria bacterium]|nr:hypothetical protein [Candidatus Sungbacteria bacterium]
MAVLSILIIVLSAYCILRRFAKSVFISGEETLVASIPLGFASFALLTSFFGIVFPTIVSALTTLGLFLILGIFSFTDILKKKQKLFECSTFGRSHRIVFGILFIACSGALIFLILQSFVMHPDGSVSITRGAAVDAPYHLAQITRIGYTAHLDFEEPNFSGEFIRYPFFINLISGVLLKFGAPLGLAFHLPLVLLVMSCVYFLKSFFLFFGFGKVFTVFSVLGTLFGSGLGYIGYWQGLADATLPIRNGVLYPMQNISYPGMIPGFLIVQRPFLLGFALFLIGCILFFRAVRDRNTEALVVAGVLLGLLPFSHTHSFIALSLVIGSGIAYLLFTKNDLFHEAVRKLVFSSFFIAIPQLASLMLLPRFPAGSLVTLRLGWMSGAGQVGGVIAAQDGSRFFPWLRYFATNFGALAFLPVWVTVTLKNISRGLLFPFVALPALVLWVIPNIIQFQVWDFDTNKFFAYALLVSFAVVGLLIEEKKGIS